MVIISICGNIGSGKSTVVKRLKEERIYEVEEEPTVNSEKLLDDFYRDMKRWSFQLQIKVIMLYKSLKNKFTLSDRVYIVERSPWESRKVFAQSLLATGNMEMHEFQLYNDVYVELGWKADITIYLRTSTETCMERIVQRGRECEKYLEKSYIENLQDYYETCLNDENIEVVDGNKDKDAVYDEVKKIISKYSRE